MLFLRIRNVLKIGVLEVSVSDKTLLHHRRQGEDGANNTESFYERRELPRGFIVEKLARTLGVHLWRLLGTPKGRGSYLITPSILLEAKDSKQPCKAMFDLKQK